jgi:hypothetical protein
MVTVKYKEAYVCIDLKPIYIPGLSLQEEHLLSLPFSSLINHLGETGWDE